MRFDNKAAVTLSLLLLVLVSALIRLDALDCSLWLDEIHSLRFAAGDHGNFTPGTVRRASNEQTRFDSKSTLSSVWKCVKSDDHPPLYFFILNLWARTAGDSVLSTRFLSVIISLFSIPLIFFLGRQMIDARVGLTAAALLSVSGMNIIWGSYVRSYSLVVLLTIASFLFLHRLIKDDEPPLRIWIGYILTSAALFYTHYQTLVLLAGHLTAIAILKPRLLPKWSIAALITAMLFLPAAILIKTRLDSGVSSTSWIMEPLAIDRSNMLNYYLHYAYSCVRILLWIFSGIGFGGYTERSGAVPLLIAIILGAIGIGRLLQINHKRELTVLLCWILFPTLGILFFDIITGGKSRTVERYFYFISPAGILIAAAGLSSVKKAWISYALLALTAAFNIIPINYFYQIGYRDDWRSAARMIDAQASMKSLILISRYHEAPCLNYYLRRPLEEMVVLPKDMKPLEESTEKGYEEIWFVTRGSAAEIEPYASALSAKYSLLESRDFYNILVRRWERKKQNEP